MIKKNKAMLLLLFLSILTWGCASEGQKKRHAEFKSWLQKDGRVKVLSTIAMINDLVEQIGGEHVHGHVLIDGELDPHSYQLVKGDDEKLAYSDVIFYNGLGLEHGPSLRETLSTSTKAVALGDKIQEADPDLILHYNGALDPHIWMDVSMWERTVPYIVETLSKYDPAHASDFQANAAELRKRMQAKHQEVKLIMSTVPEEDRYLVTSHDAFNYFTRAYLAAETEEKSNSWQKRFAAPEGLAPDSQLSTTDIQLIIDHMQKYQINVLFPECNVSRDSMNKILQAGEEIGLEVKIVDICLYSDSMGPSGSEGDTYLKMVIYNAKQIAKHFKKARHASND